MKKLSILILSSFISATMLSYFVGVALAETEQPTLQIYYSESLGTGEKVMHITACEKEPAVGVVACSKEYIASEKFGKQCDADSKIGNTIKGCLTKNGGEYVTEKDSPYPHADTVKHGQNGCPELSDQGYLYGKLKALVPTNDAEGSAISEYKDSDIEYTAAAPFGEDSDPSMPEVKPPHARKYLPLYQATLCASWDKVIDSTGEVGEDTTLTSEQQEKIYNLKYKLPKASLAADSRFTTEENCIGTLHGDKLDPEPMLSCTILERITGKSGTEILSKYMKIIYEWASGIVGIIAVLTMVYSGIQISMAGGDSAKIDDAKKRITQSIVGIVILFLSGLILYTINPTFFTGA